MSGQILGGALVGFGQAHAQHWVYDQQYGVPLAKRFYNRKPLTILDAPAQMQWAALDLTHHNGRNTQHLLHGVRSSVRLPV